MAKSIAVISFLVAFVSFAIIKVAAHGVRQAYKTVLTPETNDNGKLWEIIKACAEGV